MNRALSLILLPALGACGSGEWVVTTWGEEYIEEEIPAAVFADGCSATYDEFQISLTEVALLDGNGDVVADVPDPGLFDLTEPGPSEVGRVSAPATHYDTVRFVLGPDGSHPSLVVGGTLTCGAEAVTFDWSFDTETVYTCAPEALTIPAGGTAQSELTIHGDHLFYDGLENPDAEVRGEAIVAADADADGEVTLAELSQVDVAPLGYRVGQYSDVTTLDAFVGFLTRTLGHIDGEGHCQVDL